MHLPFPSLPQLPQPMIGPGRKATLTSPTDLDLLVSQVKTHLGLQHVGLARAVGELWCLSVSWSVHFLFFCSLSVFLLHANAFFYLKIYIFLSFASLLLV